MAASKEGGAPDSSAAWKNFDWSPKIQHGIYREWGIYYARVRRDLNAIDCFTEAMEIDTTDFPSAYNRSQIRRKAAELEGALKDAELAAQKGYLNADYNLEYCSALFDLNQLEKCKLEMTNNMKRFRGNKAALFENRLILIGKAFEDSTGKAMSVFLLNNQKLVERVSEINKQKAIIDERPFWKIMKEQGKCDVLSILKHEEEILSPLERARRKRAFNVLHQTYMDESWIDFMFMKELRNNATLFTEYCMRSKSYLKTYVIDQYNIMRKFMKMLQTRNPLYYVNHAKFGNKELPLNKKIAYLFRTQYQICRNMLEHLKHIHKLRKEGRVKGLQKYVEKIMGEYYTTKTNQVMCWKFEFINEVYNILALALCEQYSIPKNFKPSNEALMQLFRLPKPKTQDILPFVFGIRSSHVQSDLDAEGKKFRNRISKLESRIQFAKLSIEKSCLYNQISDLHLLQGHSEECCFNARKARKESKVCNSYIWSFLSILQILKANIMLHKVERVGEALEKAYHIAKKLKCPRLINFIEVCIACNEEELVKKSISANSSQRATTGSIPVL